MGGKKQGGRVAFCATPPPSVSLLLYSYSLLPPAVAGAWVVVPRLIAPVFDVVIQQDRYRIGERISFVDDRPVGHVDRVQRAAVAARDLHDGNGRIGRRCPEEIDVKTRKGHRVPLNM